MNRKSEERRKDGWGQGGSWIRIYNWVMKGELGSYKLSC